MKISTGRSATITLLACMIAACGSGDGGDRFLGSSGGSSNICPSGVSVCSGDTETGRIGTVRLTATGTQVIAASTNDLIAQPRMRGNDAKIAYGLMPFDKGLAAIRIKRDTDGTITAANLLLSELGLSWDGSHERPAILESFGLQRGRIQPGTTGLATLAALPAASDTNFWNNAPASGGGTQANYANNIYFTRDASLDWCATGDTVCIDAAKNGLRLRRGNWRNGGITPDQIDAGRLHEDGATQAPDHIPFAGFKGYRNLWNWNYRYANLSGWITQDTVAIVEWGGSDEHNSGRRGVVAFGEPTPAKTIPSSGSANYLGLVHGWYSPDGAIEPYPIAADVEIHVDFAAHTARLRLFNLRVDEDQNPSPQLSAESTNTLTLAASANTVGGPVTHGDASGNLGARFYGPVSNGAPAEIAGTFSVRGSGGGPIAGAIFGLGGFIAQRVAS